MTNTETKLDNPVWHSLQETHKAFSVDFGGICFYRPAYCPFGGFIHDDNLEQKLNHYAALNPNFFIVGKYPKHDASLVLDKELVCNQMILENPIEIKASKNDDIITELTNKTELFNLVNDVQPGYFRSETAELGSYFGIYKKGSLIAVTGERMKMDAYTEVSAVVTHPDHTGLGYAKRLVTYVANKIFSENKVPYLHVAETNSPAIALYEKLGFRTRRKISFWNFTSR